MRQFTSSHVVVGLDGSPSSQRALDLAAVEAGLRDVPLCIIVVHDRADDKLSADTASQPLMDSERMVADARVRVLRHHPTLSVEADAIAGTAASALLAESARSCLTIVGRQGRGNPDRLSAGSTCVQVATLGQGPIMVTPATPALEPAPVVVGVNPATLAPAAIDFAFAEAALRGVALRAVYACCQQPEGGIFEPPDFDADTDGRAARALAEALAGWSGKYPDVTVEHAVEHSQVPAAALLAVSHHASLVVLGPHQRLGPPGLPLGTVAATLIHHALCPVAIVHPGM